jgi:hypothetical protein
MLVNYLKYYIKKVPYGNDYSQAMPNGNYRAFLWYSPGWSVDHSSGEIDEDPLLPVTRLKDSQVSKIHEAFKAAGLEPNTHYRLHG